MAIRAINAAARAWAYHARRTDVAQPVERDEASRAVTFYQREHARCCARALREMGHSQGWLPTEERPERQPDRRGTSERDRQRERGHFGPWAS